uniref:Uncharacterized protein n=1 Tax=Cacopsylla melanoneura TaxID=428564 RepID=A0A8D9ED96_9HEMI
MFVETYATYVTCVYVETLTNLRRKNIRLQWNTDLKKLFIDDEFSNLPIFCVHAIIHVKLNDQLSLETNTVFGKQFLSLSRIFKMNDMTCSHDRGFWPTVYKIVEFFSKS